MKTLNMKLNNECILSENFKQYIYDLMLFMNTSEHITSSYSICLKPILGEDEQIKDITIHFKHQENELFTHSTQKSFFKIKNNLGYVSNISGKLKKELENEVTFEDNYLLYKELLEEAIIFSVIKNENNIKKMKKFNLFVKAVKKKAVFTK